ncbi:MAG TPA: hypothetical protein VK752_28625 [Bryobacteraceae bacterium]|nr:hypothetical protein [Bryobacteraceae bacterium]
MMAVKDIKKPAAKAAPPAVRNAALDSALAAPPDPCLPVPIGYLSWILAKMDNDNFGDDWDCLRQLCASCITARYISTGDARAIEMTSRILCRTANRDQEPVIAELSQFISFCESEDQQLAFVFGNCITRAQIAVKSFGDSCSDCLQRAPGINPNSIPGAAAKVNDALSGIQQALGAFSAILVSCDCAVETGHALDSLRREFQPVESTCCVLLCEFNRCRVPDEACWVLLEEKLFEIMQQVVFARRALGQMKAMPVGIGPELERAREMAREALKIGGVSERFKHEMRRVESALDRLRSERNHASTRELAGTIDSLSDNAACGKGIERALASQMIGILFVLACRAGKSTAIPPHHEPSGFEVDVPPEVRRVTARDLHTGESTDLIPVNNQVRLERGKRVEFSIFDAEDTMIDSVILEA